MRRLSPRGPTRPPHRRRPRPPRHRTWDDSWLVRRERELRKTRDSLPARLWLSVGSDDDAPRVKAARSFFRQLEASRYRDLKLVTRVVEGERHAAMKNESYNRGLRFVLAPFAPKPSK